VNQTRRDDEVRVCSEETIKIETRDQIDRDRGDETKPMMRDEGLEYWHIEFAKPDEVI